MDEHERRMEVFNQGGTCKEMGEKLFLSPKTVHAWIKRNNLPYNKPKGNRLPEEEHNRRLSAYHKHTTNRDMADDLNIHIECIRKWIRDNGLTQKNKVKRKIHIGKGIIVWDNLDGTVGRDKKRRSYVNNMPEKERELVNDFMSILIEANRKEYVPVTHIMSLFRKGEL